MSRILGLAFRGTGGVIGEDYVSRVFQGVSDLVEEINPEFPATMGGLPVGTAGGPSDPSMQRGVLIAYEDAIRIFLQRYALDPRIGVVIGGYSAGAVAAALFREWLLKHYPKNYVCSFSIGDPTRPVGGVFFGGKPAPGRGISSWRFGDVKDWRHCWLSQPGDMYTSVPDSATGDILEDFYDIISNVELSDPVKTFRTIMDEIPQIISRVGVNVDDLIKMLGGKDPLGGIANAGFGLIVNSIFGAISGKQKGLGAIIEAIVVALSFVATQPVPTWPHISYEHERPPGYGGTYIDLAIQHVRDWSSRPR